MRFQSRWQPVIESGDKKAELNAEDGTHSPPYEEMTDELKSLIDELVSSAEAILDEFTADMAKDATRQYSVDASGYLNEGEPDITRSSASLNVEQTA